MTAHELLVIRIPNGDARNGWKQANNTNPKTCELPYRLGSSKQQMYYLQRGESAFEHLLIPELGK